MASSNDRIELRIAKANNQYSTFANTGDVIIYTRQSNKLILQSGNQRGAIVVDNNNNVGIGKSSPASQLDISGNASISNILTSKTININSGLLNVNVSHNIVSINTNLLYADGINNRIALSGTPDTNFNNTLRNNTLIETLTTTNTITAPSISLSGITPITITSNAKINNLNADLLDGLDSIKFMRTDIDTTTLGSVTANRFISIIPNGTAPFTVQSSTKVTNLNSDLLDGFNSTFFLDSSNINTGTLNVAYGGIGTQILNTNKILVGNGSNSILSPSNLTWNNNILDVSGNIKAYDIDFAGDLYKNGELYISSQWTDGSNNKLYYDLGYVGIGTNNPQESLDVSGNIKVSGNIIPSNDSIYNLGSASKRWKDIYLSGNTIDLSGALIKRDASGIILVNSNNDKLDARFNNIYLDGNISAAGNLSVLGTLTTIDSIVVTVQDPIITLGLGTPTSNDGKDRGVEFLYYNGSIKQGFFGFDNSSSNFVYLLNTINSNEVLSGTYGNIQAGSFISSNTSGAPFTVSSSGLVTNLNSELLDSQDGSYYLNWNNFDNIPNLVNTFNNRTGNVTLTTTDISEALTYVPLNETTYNASDILAKLITVDGSGSQLDADFLDGENGMYYRNMNNVNNGTLKVEYGGTGNNSLTSGKLLVGDGTNTILTPINLTWNGSNLGIGSLSPSQQLDVSGNVYISENISASNASFIDISASNIFLTGDISASNVFLTGYISASNASFVDISASNVFLTGDISASNVFLTGDISASNAYFVDISASNASFIDISASNVYVSGNLIAPNITGNSSTATQLAVPRNIQLSGDVSGNVLFDGTSNVNISTIIQPNSVELGIDTSGNYISTIIAGTDISISGSGTENANVTIDNTSTLQTITTRGNTTTQTITAPQFISNTASGTSAFIVTSSTKVTNLNADYLDGFDGTYYLNATNTTGILSVSQGGIGTNNLTPNKILVGNGSSSILSPSDITWDGIQLEVSGNIIPSNDSIYNLGSASKRWKDIYLSGNTIDLSGALIKRDASGIILVNSNNNKLDARFNNIYLDGNISAAGNLSVLGTLTTINSIVVTIQDPIITLGLDTPTSNDGKDRGIEFLYYNGSVKQGFFGFDNSSANFVYLLNASNSNEVLSGTYGNIQAGSFISSNTSGAPFTVSSSSLVTNLNSELLDSQDGTYYLNWNNFDNIPNLVNTFNNRTGNVTLAATDISEALTYVPLNETTYNASDILAKLITVDGSGSQLDADFLDGENGMYYRNMNNVNNGTLKVEYGGTGNNSLSTGKLLVGAGTNAILTPTNLTWDGSNLGIGTNIPSQVLDISGNASFTGDINVSNIFLTGDISASNIFLTGDISASNAYFVDISASNIFLTGDISASNAYFVDISASNVYISGDLIAPNLIGNSSTATQLATSRKIQLSGDISGNVLFDGTSDVNISTIIQPNSVELGIDTSGNYISTIIAGTDISITGSGTENANVTIDNTSTLQTITNRGNTTTQTITAPQFISNTGIGTAPLIVTSSTLVTNLNADLLDGLDGTYYLNATNTTGILSVSQGGIGTNNLTANKILVGNGSSNILSPSDITWNGIQLEISGNIIPSNDSIYNLGSASKRWKDIYLSGNTIDLSGALIKRDASGIILVNSNNNKLDARFNNIYLDGNISAGGNLSVLGTLTTINSIAVTVQDPIITLGLDTPTSNDGKDRGIEFLYYNGSIKQGFFGFDNSSANFVYLLNASNSNEVLSGTYGNIQAGSFISSNTSGAPFTISSSGLVTNLNSELLDSQDGTYYLNWNNFDNIPNLVNTFNNRTGNVTLTATDISEALTYVPLNEATYNASDILAKLITVDGSGSQLDADFLDGENGMYYRNMNNVNSGTLKVEYGGTGNNSLTSGKLLVGDGTSAILTPTNLTWDGSNLGIGTNIPSQVLDVSGNIATNGNISAGNFVSCANINFSGNLYKNGQLYISSQWTDSSYNSLYYNLGNVGIGSTNPTQQLDISGTMIVDNFIVRDEWFIANDTPYIRTQLQVQGISKTFVVTSNTSIFDISMNGRYRLDKFQDVHVYIDGVKLGYYDSSNNDYIVTVNAQTTYTTFTITLSEIATIGSIVDIIVYPRFLTDDAIKEPGYIYQVINSPWDVSNNSAYYIGNVGIGTNNPSQVLDISGNVYISGNLIASNITGNSSTATQLATPRKVQLSGDVSGNVLFDGTSNVNISTIIQPNSVELGIDTSGNYISTIIAGTDISISGSGTENANVTIGNTATLQTITNRGNTTTETITAPQFISNTGIGTAPFIVTSSTLVTNLNADLLDGLDSTYYLDATNTTGILSVSQGGIGTNNLTANKILVGNGSSNILSPTDITWDGIQLEVSGNIIPSNDSIYNLGSSTKRWKDIYLSGNTIDLSGALIKRDASGIILVNSNNNKLDARFNNIYLDGNISAGGNLSVLGTLTTINSIAVTVQDPIITLGLDTPTSNDGKDRGIEFLYYNGSIKQGFFGFDNSSANFVYLLDATNSNEVLSGTYGNIQAGSFISSNTSGAPFTVSSSSLVTNLNSELLDSQDGTYYLNWNNFDNIPNLVNTFNNRTGNVTLTATDISEALTYVPLNEATYNASDILAKLITVDGSGSQLDADFLDGENGMYYRNMNNVNSGTLKVEYGGTGNNSLTSGKLLVGNGTNSILTPSDLTWDGFNLDVSGNVSFTGDISASNVYIIGTISATDIDFSGDLYKNGQLYISSQWTDTLDSSNNDLYYNLGNIGIGSTIPSQALDVSGNAFFTGDISASNAYFSGDISASNVYLTGDISASNIYLTGNLIASNITGNSSTATQLAVPRNIQLSGDVSGNVLFDGTSNVNISTIIQPNSVELGIDTSGNYISTIIAGTDISVSGSGTENANVTINNNSTLQTITTRGNTTTQTITAPQFISNTGIGTAPFIVTSSTLVTNLNADLLDGLDGTYYLNASNTTGILSVSQGGIGTNNLTPNKILVGNGSSNILSPSDITWDGIQLEVSGNIIPSNDSIYNLGSASKRWKDIYLSGNTIDLSGALIKRDASGIILVNSNNDKLDARFNNIYLDGNISAGGNLSVLGTLTTINSIAVTVQDPIITLGLDTPTSNDGKDRGIEFIYYNGSIKQGFFGFDNSSANFVYLLNASNSNEVFNGTYGGIQAGSFISSNTSGAPFTVSSSELVTNLNTDLLDGFDGSYYLNWNNFSNIPNLVNTFNNRTGDVTLTATDISEALTYIPLDESIYNASDILAKLITVDGSGSQLDADFLDGENGMYYRNMDNVNNGTLKVEYGGTGNNSLTSGKLLVGAGTDAILTPTNLTWNGSNLGIGSSNPTQQLDISGTMIVDNFIVRNEWFIANDTPYTRTQLQIQPINKTFITSSNNVTIFDVSLNGRYNVLFPSDVHIYIEGVKLGYYDISNNDYTVIVGNFTTYTIFTITLRNPVNIGTVVDISIYPKFITEDAIKEPGYVYQVFNSPWDISNNNVLYNNGNVGIGTNNPSQVLDISGNVYISGNLIASNITGNSSTATQLATPRKVQLSGDVSGNVLFDGTSDVNITTIIQPNSVELGIDTSGNYISTIIAGTDISISGSGTENADVTINNISTLQTITTRGNITTQTITAPQFISNIGIGTAPLIVTSSTLVTNLNADYLDGFDGTYYLNATNTTGILSVSQGGIGTNNLTPNKILVGNGSSNILSPSDITWDGSQLEVSGNIIPSNDSIYNLGSSSKRWRDIYLSGSTIDLSGALIKRDASGIILVNSNNNKLDARFNNIYLDGNISAGGNLSVLGTLTTINSIVVTVQDPIITLGLDTPSSNDGKDRGIEFLYYNGSVKQGFFGFDNSSSNFVYLLDATNSNEVLSGTYGGIQAGSFISSNTSGAPFTVSSSGLVTNLNSELLDSQDGTYYLNWNNFDNIPNLVNTFNNRTGNVTLTTTDISEALTYVPLNETTYNASDILAKLITVDGSGSQLDADFLDGENGMYYRNMNNVNNGTLKVEYGGTGNNSLTSGKLLVGDGTSAILTPSDLTWDGSNLGIGTSIPQGQLHMKNLWIQEIGNVRNYKIHFGDIYYNQGIGKYIGFRIEWDTIGSRKKEIKVKCIAHITGLVVGFIRFEVLIDTLDDGILKPGKFYELENYVKQISSINNLMYSITRYNDKGVEVKVVWDSLTMDGHATIQLDVVSPLGNLVFTEIHN